jgi:WD40 repeat protein
LSPAAPVAVTPTQPPATAQTRAVTQPPTPAQPPPKTTAPKPAASGKISADNAAQLKQVGQATFDQPAHLVWSTDGNRLVVFDGGGLLLLDGKTLETKGSVRMTQPDILYDVASDGQTMAISGDWTKVTLRNAVTNQVGNSISPSLFAGLEFTPDGKSLLLMSAGKSPAASLWDVNSGKLIKNLSGFQASGQASGPSFTPDQKSLVWDDNGLVKLMDINSQKLSPSFEHEGFVEALAVSGDGKLLTTSTRYALNGNKGQFINIWDTQSGQNLGKIKVDDIPLSLTFLSASHILAGGIGKQVLIWDADTQKQIVSLTGHSDQVMRLAFSPDGTSLASTGADLTVRLWRVNP